MLFDAFVIWTAICLYFWRLLFLESWWVFEVVLTCLRRRLFSVIQWKLFILQGMLVYHHYTYHIFLVYIFNHFSVLSTWFLLNNLFSLTAVIHQVSVQQFTPSLNFMLSSECYASVVVQLKFNVFILCCWWTLVPAKPANLILK